MKRHLHLIAIAAISGAMAAGAIQSLFSARADQHELIPPTSGIYSGPEYVQLLGNAFRSLASCNKGPDAPAIVAGAAVDGLCWIDDHASPWLVKRYVGGNWVVESALDNVNGVSIGTVGGGAASIASGSTVDLGSVPQANITITGTSDISNFGASAPLGAVKFVDFDNALWLVNSGNLIVPGGFPLKTAAGDSATLKHQGLGVWKVAQYTRANGIPVDISAVGEIKYTWSTVSPVHLPGYGQAINRADYPAYVAKTTRSQPGAKTAGNATITVSSTEELGPGMPVEGVGIASGCTIATFVTNTSITLNSSSCVTVSGTATITVFPTGYGAGGNSSTIAVRDCRGYALAGRDSQIPGSYANRLTTSYFGAFSFILGVPGGSESKTLAATELPSNIPYTDPGHTHAVQGDPNAVTGLSNSPGGLDYANGSKANRLVTGAIALGSATTSITINPSGGAPHRTVQPTLIVGCLVRVTA